MLDKIRDFIEEWGSVALYGLFLFGVICWVRWACNPPPSGYAVDIQPQGHLILPVGIAFKRPYVASDGAWVAELQQLTPGTAPEALLPASGRRTEIRHTANGWPYAYYYTLIEGWRAAQNVLVVIVPQKAPGSAVRLVSIGGTAAGAKARMISELRSRLLRPDTFDLSFDD